jgi:hypothetical protein
MNWYQYTDDKGNKSVIWQKGDDDNVTINGQPYEDIGETYTQQINASTSITFTQNEVTSITTSTMTKDEWVSQYSKDDWNGTPANKACNKASDAMLANDGVKSSGMTIIVNNAGNGRAGSANGNADKAITDMSNAIDQNVPTKVNVDYKPGSGGSADKMGDHFVVVEGKTEAVKNGQVTSTTFRYFDPGTSNQNKGTSPSNTLSVMNRTLVGDNISVH